MLCYVIHVAMPANICLGSHNCWPTSHFSKSRKYKFYCGYIKLQSSNDSRFFLSLVMSVSLMNLNIRRSYGSIWQSKPLYSLPRFGMPYFQLYQSVCQFRSCSCDDTTISDYWFKNIKHCHLFVNSWWDSISMILFFSTRGLLECFSAMSLQLVASDTLVLFSLV